MRTVLHSNRTGPTVISDTRLITRDDFAALPKCYTNNTGNIQKLIHYWFHIPILHSNFTISQRSLQTSLLNSEIPIHPLSTLQQPPLPAHGWSCAPLPRSAVVHPKCAKPRIPEIGQHSKEGFVGGGVPHLRNLISYSLYQQTRTGIAMVAHAAHGWASIV
jgi:hypothetical protein